MCVSPTAMVVGDFSYLRNGISDEKVCSLYAHLFFLHEE